MKRDDDKIRVQLDSTVGDFKAIIDVLDKFLKDRTNIPSSYDQRVIKFRDMLQQQVMKD